LFAFPLIANSKQGFFLCFFAFPPSVPGGGIFMSPRILFSFFGRGPVSFLVFLFNPGIYPQRKDKERGRFFPPPEFFPNHQSFVPFSVGPFFPFNHKFFFFSPPWLFGGLFFPVPFVKGVELFRGFFSPFGFYCFPKTGGRLGLSLGVKE